MKKYLMAALFLLAHGIAIGATHDCGDESEFTTAIAAMADGDIIIISGSWTSTGVYTIDNNVEIYGSSASNTIKLGVDSNYFFTFSTGASGASIHDLTIDCDKASRTTGTAILTTVPITIYDITISNPFNYGVVANTTGLSITGVLINTVGGPGINKNSAGNGIRINSLTTGAVITGNTITNDSSSSTGIFLNGADSNTISENTITGCGRNGIELYDSADGNTISGNVITNVGMDGTASDFIAVGGENTIVSSNILTQSSDPSAVVWGVEILGGADACDGSVISGNIITGQYMTRGLSGGGSSIAIAKNYIESTTYGIYYQNTDASSIYYNQIIGTALTAGIVVEAFSAGTYVASIYNNTVVGTSGTGIRYEETTGVFGASNLKNNIIRGFDKGVVIEDKDDDGHLITHTNNLYYGNTADAQKDVGGSFSAIELHETETTTDPLFINAHGSDYRLKPSSPAINAGTDVSLTTDYANNAIVGNPDIGALESFITFKGVSF